MRVPSEKDLQLLEAWCFHQEERPFSSEFDGFYPNTTSALANDQRAFELVRYLIALVREFPRAAQTSRWPGLKREIEKLEARLRPPRTGKRKPVPSLQPKHKKGKSR